MGMTVKRRKDQAVPRVFEHKVADIPGGVSVKTSELGGVLLLSVGGKASKITKIDTSQKAADTLTLSAAIGVIPVLSVVAEAKAETTGNDAELKHIPLSLSGRGRPVVQNDNLDTDAWVMGTTHGATLHPDVEKHLKGIVNY